MLASARCLSRKHLESLFFIGSWISGLFFAQVTNWPIKITVTFSHSGENWNEQHSVNSWIIRLQRQSLNENKTTVKPKQKLIFSVNTQFQVEEQKVKIFDFKPVYALRKKKLLEM